MTDKTVIRKQITEIKARMSEEDIASRSSVLCGKLIASEAYKNADIVLVYMSANQEVRTEEIIRKALADHKKAAVPVTYNGGRMEFVSASSVSSFRTRMGIQEPIDGTVLQIVNDPLGGCPGFENEVMPADSRILILMPGLAFGRDMNRIGYGGGYYDRYVQRLWQAGYSFTKAALCYDFQVFDSLECEEHDALLDILISA